jgi:hypothetical protein
LSLGERGLFGNPGHEIRLVHRCSLPCFMNARARITTLRLSV